MDPITAEEFKSFAPNAREEYVTSFVNGWGELKKAGIATEPRVCEFLGVAAHETQGFTLIRERTSWTPKQLCTLWPTRFKTQLDPRILACGRDEVKLANLVYSGREDIGNRGGDDGYNYRGGGWFQATGRENYRRAGLAIGTPLEENPQFIEYCDISLRAAIWEWLRKDCNRYADRGYTRAINNAINRGNAFSSKDPIGWESRVESKRRAYAIFGPTAQFLPGLALGADGSEVEVLQRRLKELNYPVGTIDNVFGPVLARAVAGFKLDYKRRGGDELEPDEVVGERTWAALKTAQPVVYVARKDATVKDLKGSETVTAAQDANTAATMVVAASAAKGASETGMLDGMQDTLGWAPQMHAFMSPVIDAASFGLKNFFWVITLIGGVWFWTKGRHIIKARLKDHIQALNLGR